MSALRFLCVRCGRAVKQDGTVWVHDEDHSPACPPPSSHEEPSRSLRCPACQHTILLWIEVPSLLDVEVALNDHTCQETA